MTHDPMLCFCGTPIGCSCHCERCLQARQREQQVLRLMALEEKLKKADISPDDFAELIWRLIEPTIEARIEKMANEAIRTELRNVSIIIKQDQ